MESDPLGKARGKGNIGTFFLIPLVCLGLFLIWRCAPGWQEVRQETEPKGSAVRFMYVDGQATAVCVTGSFNAWSEHADRMSRSGDTWSATVSLAPGRYQYVFVVDGRLWRADPGNPLAEDDGFGTKNSVLVVE